MAGIGYSVIVAVKDGEPTEEARGENVGVELGRMLDWAEGAEIVPHAAAISTSARAAGLICG